MDQIKKMILTQLPARLLPWYEVNKRDLPWRKNREPYHIWVSEIMLQQTRVEAVKGYYARFLEALPTVSALAEAPDDQLNKLWEGLGYYSRVRNMKRAAQVIMEQHGGVFPDTHDAILALPGIGAYTAGAICSIAFDQPTPAVDGNVLRVLSRLTDDATPIDTPACKAAAQAGLGDIYPRQAGAFTQALMELGATVCGPNRKPDCGSCPCGDICLAAQAGTAEQLPVKAPKRERRIEHHTVFILRCGDRFAIEKRPGRGLLAGLWQFPNTPGTMELSDALAWLEEKGLKTKEIIKQVERKHIFTHVQWHMRGIYLEVSNEISDYLWVTLEQMDAEAALPTAFRLFREEIEESIQ